MSDEFHFYAPTGEYLQGTSEMIPGTASIVFTGPDWEWDHDGNGTKMFWDGADTLGVAGVPLFTCESGSDWLLHHLIPGRGDDAPASLTAETLDLIHKELRLGEAFEQASKLLRSIKGDGEFVVAEPIVQSAVNAFQHDYEEAKRVALAAIEAELAARPALEEDED